MVESKDSHSRETQGLCKIEENMERNLTDRHNNGKKNQEKSRIGGVREDRECSAKSAMTGNGESAPARPAPKALLARDKDLRRKEVVELREVREKEETVKLQASGDGTSEPAGLAQEILQKSEDELVKSGENVEEVKLGEEEQRITEAVQELVREMHLRNTPAHSNGIPSGARSVNCNVAPGAASTVQEGAGDVQSTAAPEVTLLVGGGEEQVAGMCMENRCFLLVRIADREFKALFDSGAMISIIGSEIAGLTSERLQPCHTTVKSVIGNTSKILGALNLQLDVDGVVQTLQFHALDSIDHAMILGIDFCKQRKIETKLPKGLWRIEDGNWRAFTNDGESTMKIFAECAGISEIDEIQREQIDRLVESILPPPTKFQG